MTAALDILRFEVDKAWVGQSAEQFKKNMETDKALVSSNLEKTYDILEKMIKNQVGGTIQEADENLVKAREV